MKKIGKIWLVVTVVAIGFSCNGKKADSAEPADDGLVEITQAQFQASGMKVGKISQQTFRDKISCKGYVSAPSSAMSKICPLIPGKVNSLRYKIGDYVPAGAVVATVSGNDFMALQQSFAEAAAAYAKAKGDYDRVLALWAENIGAKKDVQAAKASYQASYASYQSLRSRIAALGISPARVESGRMYTHYPVVAPIGGYLTRTDAVIGQYIDMETPVAELVDLRAVQLRLSVYETDMDRLKVGQLVVFATAGSDDRTLSARLSTIGKTVNPDSKMVDCIATIDQGSRLSLVNESFVSAEIVVAARQHTALPVGAVQKHGNEYTVYVGEKHRGNVYKLKKTVVSVGMTDGDYIEVKTPLTGRDIVLQGIGTMQ
jgi:cobalt-zinc-cadmium efflux system membrane fusion protein